MPLAISMKACTLAAFLLISFSAVADEMHTFNLPDGRSLEAGIFGFNDKQNMVELQRADGKRVKVKPDIFVEEDQKYINDWAMIKAFKSPSTLRVSCSKKLMEKWKEETESDEIRYAEHAYEVEFENRRHAEMGPIGIEYRIYYEQETNNRTTKKVDVLHKTERGRFRKCFFAPRAKKILTTEPVVLERHHFNTSDFYYVGGDPESTSGKINGMWMRMNLKTASGQKAVRDVFEPSNIEGRYKWSTVR